MNRELRRASERRSRRLVALGSGAVLAVSAAGVVLASGVPVAHAASTFTVTQVGNDDGSGATAGTLSWAITQADSTTGAVVDFQSGLSGTIALTGDLPALTQDMTITGPGASAITISGGAHRVFYLDSAHTVSVSGLTISGVTSGAATPLSVFGGGTLTGDALVVENNAPSANRAGAVACGSSTFTLTNSTLTGNTASSGGGAFYGDTCDATIVSSTVDNNTAPGDDGGAFYSSGGSLTVENSTISGNHADDNSGAVYARSGTVVTISNSTIADNTATNASNAATAISLSGGASLSVFESTITGNHHTGSGDAGFYAALYIQGGNAASAQHNASVENQRHPGAQGGPSAQAAGTVSLVGTILTGNGPAGPNNFDIGLSGGSATVSSDHSIIGVTQLDITVTDGGGTLRGVDPLLGPLANNGGPTQTMALLAGSPAIDTGPSPLPDYPLNTNDQRGAGFARVVNGTVDIGAFEVQPPPAPAAAPVEIAPRFTG